MEAGAGTGRLCREVLRAEPECAPALREVQRELLTVEPFEHALGPSTPDVDGIPQPVGGSGPIVSALEELPALVVDGVVIANELLDNLAFDLVERSEDGWTEIRVGVTDAGAFYEVPVPASEEIISWLDDVEVPAGARLPVQHAAGAWIDDCAARLHRGMVLVLDYAAELDELVGRGAAPDGSGWLRTYRGHRRGGPPLDDPGAQDITTDVLLPTLRREARRAGFTVASETTQAAWLRSVGIDALVDEGRRAWEAGAARGDLAALAGRSRVTEAAALTDLGGLGAHTVIVLATRR